VGFLGGFFWVGFLLPTLPQGAGREGARTPARRPREEHQSRQGGDKIPYLMPVLWIGIRIHIFLGLPDPDPLGMDPVWIRIRILLSSRKNSKKNLGS
jgi:hypothetical protein